MLSSLRIKDYNSVNLQDIKVSYKESINERGLGKSPLLEKVAKICTPAGILSLLSFMHLRGTRKRLIKKYEVFMCLLFTCLFVIKFLNK